MRSEYIIDLLKEVYDTYSLSVALLYCSFNDPFLTFFNAFCPLYVLVCMYRLMSLLFVMALGVLSAILLFVSKSAVNRK